MRKRWNCACLYLWGTNWPDIYCPPFLLEQVYVWYPLISDRSTTHYLCRYMFDNRAGVRVQEVSLNLGRWECWNILMDIVDI